MHNTLTKFQYQYQKAAPTKKYTGQKFTKLLSPLMDREELNLTDVAVYGYLFNCKGDNEYSRPFRKTIAKKCKSSERSVDRSISKLKELGLIIVVRRGLRKSNLYYFPHHEWFESGKSTAPEKNDICQKNIPGDTYISAPHKAVPESPQWRVLIDEKNHILKKINKKNNSTPPVDNFWKRKVGRPPKHPTQPPTPPHLVAEFPEVWNSHPRHNRPEFAFREFVKAREKVSLATIKGALDDYHKTLDWRDRLRFCKGLGRWFSEQNWKTRKEIDMTEYTKPLRTNFPAGHFSEIPREDREKIANGLKGLVIALQTSEAPKQPLKVYSPNLNLIKPVGGVYGKIRIHSTSEQQNAA